MAMDRPSSLVGFWCACAAVLAAIAAYGGFGSDLRVTGAGYADGLDSAVTTNDANIQLIGTLVPNVAGIYKYAGVLSFGDLPGMTWSNVVNGSIWYIQPYSDNLNEVYIFRTWGTSEYWLRTAGGLGGAYNPTSETTGTAYVVKSP